MNKDSRFVIVGLGLLGGAYALGLRKAGFEHVAAIDLKPEALAFAKEKGYIEEGRTEGFEDLLARADYVIFSLYPTAFIQWVEKYGACLPAGCLCTDVSGVKAGLVDKVQALLPEGVEFIASHPMAGKERSGVEHAHLVDFAPANFLITPTEQNSEGAVDFARSLAKALCFAHVHVISPEEHDRIIGYVSQLTHAIAVSLMCAPGAERFADYTGDSFRDLTRIAYLNAPMWAELFLWNREYLTEEIDAFTGRLQQLKGYLQNGQREELESMFHASSAARAAFDKKEKEG